MKWVPKNKTDNNENQDSYKSVKNFPEFHPYPSSFDNNENVWSYRPPNAPSSVDPKCDIPSELLHSKNGRGGRGRGRGRGRGGYNNYSNESRGHSSYNRSYQNSQSRTSGYDGAYYQQQTPSHQQWYPQHGHGHTQQSYYPQLQQGGYTNYYGGNGGYQHQHQQQQQSGYYQQTQHDSNNYGGYNQHQSYQRAH